MSGMLKAVKYIQRKFPLPKSQDVICIRSLFVHTLLPFWGFVEAYNKGHNEFSKINTGIVSLYKGKGKKENMGMVV